MLTVPVHLNENGLKEYLCEGANRGPHMNSFKKGSALYLRKV